MIKYLKHENTSAVRIRPVRFCDVDAWLDCLRRNFPNRDFARDLFWDRDTWGAFDNGKLVGCVSLWDNELQWLALDRKYEGQYLDLLLNRALSSAADRGMDLVTVKVNPIEPEMARLLADFNFDEISEYEFLRASQSRHGLEANETVPA
jgi:hypothetical protein